MSLVSIYMNHRGPFALSLTVEVPGKKGGEPDLRSSYLAGPFNAEEAHEESRVLVNASNGERVSSIHVFSCTEHQFIGAMYKRGCEYRPWSEDLCDYQRGLELPDAQTDDIDPAALLPEQGQPLRPVDAADDGGVPVQAVPAHRPVRRLPAEARTAPPRRVGLPLELDPGNAERWPGGPGAALVREALERLKQATGRDLAAAIADDCMKAGIGFPASLISRLKQGGFLREATE